MFHLVSDDSARVAPPGCEWSAVCIVLPIMQRICGDENSPSIVLSGEEGKQENSKWWRNTPPSCHRPATHPSQQSYLMTPGNRNVCYSCWRVRSGETAVLCFNSSDVEKPERSQIPLHSRCRQWAVIIIQHLHFWVSGHRQGHTHIQKLMHFSPKATNNVAGWVKPQQTEPHSPRLSAYLMTLADVYFKVPLTVVLTVWMPTFRLCCYFNENIHIY